MKYQKDAINIQNPDGTFRISSSEARGIKRIAESEGLTQTAYIRRLLRMDLEQHGYFGEQSYMIEGFSFLPFIKLIVKRRLFQYGILKKEAVFTYYLDERHMEQLFRYVGLLVRKELFELGIIDEHGNKLI